MTAMISWLSIRLHRSRQRLKQLKRDMERLSVVVESSNRTLAMDSVDPNSLSDDDVYSSNQQFQQRLARVQSNLSLAMAQSQASNNSNNSNGRSSFGSAKPTVGTLLANSGGMPQHLFVAAKACSRISSVRTDEIILPVYYSDYLDIVPEEPAFQVSRRLSEIGGLRRVSLISAFSRAVECSGSRNSPFSRDSAGRRASILAGHRSNIEIPVAASLALSSFGGVGTALVDGMGNQSAYQMIPLAMEAKMHSDIINFADPFAIPSSLPSHGNSNSGNGNRDVSNPYSSGNGNSNSGNGNGNSNNTYSSGNNNSNAPGNMYKRRTSTVSSTQSTQSTQSIQSNTPQRRLSIVPPSVGLLHRQSHDSLRQFQQKLHGQPLQTDAILPVQTTRNPSITGIFPLESTGRSPSTISVTTGTSNLGNRQQSKDHGKRLDLSRMGQSMDGTTAVCANEPHDANNVGSVQGRNISSGSNRMPIPSIYGIIPPAVNVSAPFVVQHSTATVNTASTTASTVNTVNTLATASTATSTVASTASTATASTATVSSPSSLLAMPTPSVSTTDFRHLQESKSRLPFNDTILSQQQQSEPRQFRRRSSTFIRRMSNGNHPYGHGDT